MRPVTHHARGFALVDLAIVIIIVSLILGFSVPAYRALSAGVRLEETSRGIAEDVRRCRARAMWSGHELELAFDAHADHYQVRDLSTGRIAGPFPMPGRMDLVTSATFVMKADGSCSAAALLLVRDAAGKQDTVRVSPSGRVAWR
jgi:hypothetical protein